MLQTPRAACLHPDEDVEQVDEILGLPHGANAHVAHAVDECDRRIAAKTDFDLVDFVVPLRALRR